MRENKLIKHLTAFLFISTLKDESDMSGWMEKGTISLAQSRKLRLLIISGFPEQAIWSTYISTSYKIRRIYLEILRTFNNDYKDSADQNAGSATNAESEHSLPPRARLYIHTTVHGEVNRDGTFVTPTCMNGRCTYIHTSVNDDNSCTTLDDNAW